MFTIRMRCMHTRLRQMTYSEIHSGLAWKSFGSFYQQLQSKGSKTIIPPPTHQPTYPHQDLRIEGMKIAHVTHAHRHREVLQHEKTDTARERERENVHVVVARSWEQRLHEHGVAPCAGSCYLWPSVAYVLSNRYIAAQGQHADAVARLLAGGAAVNLAVEGGGTALHVAAQNGHTEVVAWLLAGNAEVDALMEGGITALFLAAQSGHIDVIVRLLAQGASVNIAAGNGATALHYAALHGHAESVARLLVARADVNETTRSGGTALHVAAQGGPHRGCRLAPGWPC